MGRKLSARALTAHRAFLLVGVFGVVLGIGLLINGARRNLNDSLIRAAMRGDAPAVQRLLQDGADPNTQGSVRTPVLTVAAFNVKHSGAVVEILLGRGARPDTADNSGMTALMFALASGNTDAARDLLAHGADANAVDKGGLTPLMVAAGHGNAVALRSLIGKGARINQRTALGGTALMAAASRGQAEAVTVLLDAGADTTIKNAKGRTAWDMAVHKNHSDIVALLGAVAAQHGKP